MKLTLRQVAEWVNGELHGGKAARETYIYGVGTDSREDLSGRLFIPLIGERFDGHNFIAEAFRRGAVCCLTERDIKQHNNFKIKVLSVREAMLRLAERYKASVGVKSAAITGSVGKTTCKDMLASVLGQKLNVLKTEGNFNNEVGLPLTIFRLDSQHEYAVFEIGMSRAGEIRSLSQVVKPDICIITNIGVSHIEYLGSREGILRAKCEIFENMQPNGLAVLNGDDDMLTALKLDFPVLYYGFGPGNDVRAEDVVADGLRGTLFTVRQGDIHFRAKTPLPGIHLVRTALAVSAVGLRLGLSPQEIAQGIESFKPSKMRMDIIRTNSRITLINDAYNAGPESMKAALDILAQAGGRRVCVLGDMLELGAYSRELHEDIGRYAGAVGIDLAVFVGENSRYAFEAFEDAKAINAGNTAMYFESKSELLKELHGLLHKRDTVLVKASRGMGFEDVVTEITR